MPKVLEFENVTKVFHQGGLLSLARITANDHVTFHVNQSEIFVLAGESGCGKTTAAKIILGFEEPTEGAVIHNEKRGVRKSKREVWLTEGVQAIFQDPFATFNPLRVVDRYFFETVKNFRLAKTRAEAIKIIDEKLRAVGLSYADIATKYPSEFSGGQLQRISIARALLTDPVLLIADEPVSMVDASLRMSIVNLFRELRDNFGVSVIYITHDLATAYYVGDRIAIMYRGNIIERGPAADVLTNPQHPYTQLLRESIPEANPDKKWQSTVRLSDAESEDFQRTGCKFAGRCPHVMEVCRTALPPEYERGEVRVRCYLYADEQEARDVAAATAPKAGGEPGLPADQ
ncbi:MAG: ABC transporter ATP-binding protein [Spirochaetota bacterium]